MESNSKSTCCAVSKDTWTSVGILMLRLVVGVFMMSHGWQKLSNFEMMSTVFPDPIGLGSGLSLGMIVFAEFFCSILILLGLFTRLSTIPLIIGMLVAAFVIHANDPFATKELPLLYLSVYVSIAFVGAGKFSIDYLLHNTYSKVCKSVCKK